MKTKTNIYQRPNPTPTFEQIAYGNREPFALDPALTLDALKLASTPTPKAANPPTPTKPTGDLSRGDWDGVNRFPKGRWS